MKTKYLLASGLVMLVAAAAAAQDSVAPQVRWAQVSACAAERSAEARHACMDAVLRAAGVLDAATETAVNRENFGRPIERLAPTPPPVAQPARAEPAPVSAVAPVAPPPPVEGVTARIASARVGGDRRLVVETDEGAVWRQVDNDLIRRVPRAGDLLEVRRGALGSFRCTLNDAITFRCERRD